MNRFDRVSSILILLQSRQWITAGEMASRFEVSLRTIYRDLTTLEQAGIPLCAEPGRGYSLADGFHLPPVMLTTDEAATLLLAEKMMSKLSDQSAQACFRTAFDKIRAVLPARDQAMIEQLNSTIEVFHNPSHSADESNQQYLTLLQQALAKHEMIKIGYESFYNNAPLQEREVEPVGLCFYSMHWHLIAWCCLRNDYRDFRVDRIRSLSVVGTASHQHHHISLKQYFQSLTDKGQLHEVTITVTPRTAVMMEPAGQYYGFLESTKMGNHVSMLFVTSDFSWLGRWLMMYIDGIVQLEPLALKLEMEKLMASKKF